MYARDSHSPSPIPGATPRKDRFPGKPEDVPVSPSVRLTKADCQEREKGDLTHAWYRSVVMSLNYAANWTRPDLAYLVSKCAKFMQAPGEVHVKFLKRGLRYLRGKTDLGLVYDFVETPLRRGLYGFFDASHADDVDTRRSTVAYVFFFSGCAISWKTKLHSFVTTSTNHSELVASRTQNVLAVCSLGRDCCVV